MAFHEQLDFHRPSSTLSTDRKTSFFDDANESTEAPTPILGSATTMSPTFSTDAFGWDDFPAHPAAFVDRPISSNNPFYDQSSSMTFNNNNPYRASMPVQQQHQPSWPVPETPTDACTPTATKVYDPFQHDFDSGQPVSYHGMPMVTNPSQHPFSGPAMTNVKPSAVFPPSQPDNPSVPMSPHSNKEWMEMSAMEQRSAPKRMRPSSPSRPYSPGFPRRDGIRKKNARFDIPSERNLLNIDQLIAQCTDPEELKELKQQKRLLRNRQAALDSRQRKKKHTEELEEEKKLWTERMSQVEEEMRTLQLTYEREKEMWYQQHVENQRVIETLTLEKEELIRTHTLESGDLRKKVSFLTERLEQASSAMSVAPSSTSINDFASDMDNLNMGPENWDSYIFVDEFNAETPSQQTSQQQPIVQNTETSLVIANRKDLNSEEKPAASGLLLMLLLFGAFVASKSSGNSSPSLPRMPDDVRAASAAVLESVYKDAGVTPSSAESFLANRVEAVEPRASSIAWSKAAAGFGNLASTDHLDQTFSQLAGPTKDQEAEALFSMTAQQYSSLTSTDFARRVYSIPSDDVSPESLSPGSQPSYHRRNLAEALAAMREQSKGETAAEVYTRSLLWDRIPNEVVREFKRMVEGGSKQPSSEADGIKS